MADMYILSPDEEVLTVLSSDGQEACKFWDAKYKEELNKGSSFSFVADASHPDARYLVEENQVIFKDKDGLLKLFVIKELDDADENAEVNTLVTCEAAMMELAETFVKDFRPTNKTAQYVLDHVLSRSRWEAEVTASLGTNSTTFYKKSALECISEVLNLWGGELQDYIEFDGNKITRRVIKILPRRGKDSGKRFEIDKDTEKISRTVISYPLTALWGYGASIPSTDENGEETGGYTRFIDFSEVEWKKSEGDPVDKPLGQEWVGDPDLLKRFGRLKNGERIHREGQFSNEDITDPKELLKATYNHLITEASKIEVNYELSVQLLQNVPGYEHEHVELGDTTIAIDRNFAIPIETKQRIISMEYDITDPDNTCVVEIGQFLSVLQKDDRIQKIQDTIDRNRGKWDSGGEVTDGSFPDTVPPVPSNVKIESLFQGVSISWDYNPSSYIAAYEVYASPVKGFTPLPENRIFWGKGSKCEHSPGVDQVWYYRLRAINTHKTPSEFTPEFTGVTRRILTDDILFGSITADLLADLAVKADKISRDFEDANILPGSILNAPDIYTVNAKRSVNYAVNGFNEVTVTKNSTSYSYFGITTRGRPTLALTKDQVYTLSFELKRLTTKNFSYIRLLTESGASYDISNNLSDISSYPTDEFVRFDVVFTAPATFSDGRLGIGGRTVNNGDSAEFVLRKLQIRRGDVRKDFGFSPYDTQLTDGVITSQYVQDAAIVSAKIADAAITSAKIAEAAVGSAAIQNAAIKRAHLETAIIGTAQIEDGAITNAKIANLSADKINAGTIKGITIEGSLIRGARFEAAGQSENFESWIQDGTFYQWTKNADTDEYNELTITSGMLKQETGKLDYNDARERYTTIEMGNGKLSIYGTPSVGQNYGSPIIDLYSEKTVDDPDSEFNTINSREFARFRMWNKFAEVIDNRNLYSITTGPHGENDKLNEDEYGTFQPSIYLSRFDGPETIFRFKPQNFDVVASAGLRLKSGKRMLFDTPELILPPTSKFKAGNRTWSPYPAVAGSVQKAIRETYGELQYNLALSINEVTLSINTGGATGTASTTLAFLDGNYNPAENIFAVFAQPYGPYSDVVNVGIQNQSSSGFKIVMRGNGVSSGIIGQDITIRLLVVYEVP
ncbi:MULTISPECIES: prophage endopeptidase tail family protein [Bacillus]|uniref:prophage endopeptidase tail family protein n=1 Tax=Bacillus TaxID=1386 RepID=UPI00081524FC|nr:prophage endopeptidase tail family protein [Bacillus glycinifermentans]WKB76093.1 prophage endopeptidase tail family protein [Bacillus glycinifermentans]SCA87141.1 phage SPP1 structural protein [Bacillus glycinifermentans]